MMNCIIIDDDELFVSILEEYFQSVSFLNLLGTFRTPIDALKILHGENQVHLIFLDVEMPKMTGIEFLDSLKNLPQIIMMSAKEKYALDAFDYDVTDYLLKPVSQQRFMRAVEKAYSEFKSQLPTTEINNGIFIKNSSSIISLKYDDILWIQALENYISINTYDAKYTILFTMKSIEDKLPRDIFVRVHRSYIVNLSKINLIEHHNIIMHYEKGIKSIPIKKTFLNNLMSRINLIN